MKEQLKKLIFWERTDLEDALKLPLCKRLYNEQSPKIGSQMAKKEALSLCNDVLWAIFINHFEDHTRDLKYPIPQKGTAYDWRWVIAQLTDTNIETYSEEDYIDEKCYLCENINIASSSFNVNCCDEKLISLYKSIRGQTKKTWPKLVDYYNFNELLLIANVNNWPPFLSIGFNSLTQKLREIIIDDLSSQCKKKEDSLRLKKLLEDYVYHFQNFERVAEYPLLCRVIVEIQKYEKWKYEEDKKRIEGEVLELRRGNKILNTDAIKGVLDIFIAQKVIPTGKRYGYVWFAVWLFFVKNKLMKDYSTQADFERLMKAWFPNCGYGKSDLIRRYNSDYLEKYNWQIWKYEEFKKDKEKKADDKKENRSNTKIKYEKYSKIGFDKIKEISQKLVVNLKPESYWIILY